ncbi:MAG: SOS response-associated peptidase [Spirochaetales bacterium]|nr:SOS response-associated peptidase [Spirochaetales bacterium]
MCFNAAITTPLDVAQKEYNLKVANDFKYVGYGDYKVAFTHPFLPIVLEDRVLSLGKWGLIPSWVRECKKSEEIVKFTVNARVETLTEKPSFKGSVDKGRVLILMDGFYEWKEVDGKKYPYYISREDGKHLLVAGLVSPWGGVNTITLITTEALGIMRDIHNTKMRMPFFINKNDIDLWLNSSIPYSKVIEQIEPQFNNLIAIEKEPNGSY